MVIKKGVNIEEIGSRYPVLYHMAEADTWESIKKHGLRSTTALLDLFQITGLERKTIEKKHRPESIEITHPRFGKAIVRDQKPMTEAALKKCLIRLQPMDWYKILNGHVFFWPTRKRLLTMLNARTYRSLKHTVLTLDTSELLADYKEQTRLTALNSGCTKPRAWPRGTQTFMPLAKFPFLERKKYGTANIVAEIAIEYSVPNIWKYVISVDHMRAEQLLENIYKV